MNGLAKQEKRAVRKYRENPGRDAPWGFTHVRIHGLKHTFGRRRLRFRRKFAVHPS